MVALRTRSAGAFASGPFWFSALCAALTPTSIGYQDLVALLARQPGVSERWREHLIASPFGTIHAATFSFARPIGTSMPGPFAVEPVNFDPRSLDVKTWMADASPLQPAVEIAYPTVNRALKGDRLPLRQPPPPVSAPERAPPPLEPIDAPSAQEPVHPRPPVAAPHLKNTDARDVLPSPAPSEVAAELAAPPGVALPREIADTPASPALPPDEQDGARNPYAEEDTVLPDKPPEIPVAGAGEPSDASSSLALSYGEEEPAARSAQLYFGVAAMGGTGGGLERWAPGAEPMLVSPRDSDIKLSALEGRVDTGAGESVAGKGDASRLQSPAERLGLWGKARMRAEKCLADAVYFEARGEPLRGQEAVAQVVMNRVFSGYYPNNVCGVVYQNANRHLACQFTFACDGIPEVVNEPDMWAQAKRIAKDTLDGKIWLTEVSHATHYHAYWVHPSWVHEMKKMYKLGVHTFYRPRAWGDGSGAPEWGDVTATSKPEGAAARKSEAAKLPEAAASVPAAGRNEPTARL